MQFGSLLINLLCRTGNYFMMGVLVYKYIEIDVGVRGGKSMESSTA
jgi:hypothetical protein